MGKLKESFIYPGQPIFVDMLWHALRSVTRNQGVPSINCKSVDGFMSPILSEIAVCFDAKTMKAVKCGKLFGGDRGSCPKFGNIWLPNPIPQNGGNNDNSGGKDSTTTASPYPIPPNPYWPTTTTTEQSVMKGNIRIFSKELKVIFHEHYFVLDPYPIPPNPYWPPKNGSDDMPFNPKQMFLVQARSFPDFENKGQ